MDAMIQNIFYERTRESSGGLMSYYINHSSIES